MTSPSQPATNAAAGEAAASTSTPFRGHRSGCENFQSVRFQPLPATKSEVEEIVELWNSASRAIQHSPNKPEVGERQARNSDAVVESAGAHETAAFLLTEGEASEAAFKARASGRRIVHLATHAFFLGGRCKSALDSSRSAGRVVMSDADVPTITMMGDSPLVLSGLAFAGANQRSIAGPEEEDGILTAEEIAALDLSGVEWAVLSACDTGVGEVKAGEGVLGLRRAFQVAGARTLIMSLWSVEDESARRWMRALYEGRLIRRLGTAEAVREASLTLLRERRARKQSTHPFYWAGFVAAGDWRWETAPPF